MDLLPQGHLMRAAIASPGPISATVIRVRIAGGGSNTSPGGKSVEFGASEKGKPREESLVSNLAH